jgi:hypothetical protein
MEISKGSSSPFAARMVYRAAAVAVRLEARPALPALRV